MSLFRAQVEGFFSQFSSTPLEQLFLPELEGLGVNLWLKREDLVHDKVSGNKFRKLKYNVLRACDEGKSRLLSFGGAYSNHIYSLAALGDLLNVETIGIIRGDELSADNSTLSFARQCGMELQFVSREQYRNKYSPDFLESLSAQYGDYYLVPEGGSNELAVLGCAELSSDISSQLNPDYLCVACGTGGALAGLVSGASAGTVVYGFPVLKGAQFLESEIGRLLPKDNPVEWGLVHDFHFGGYAKMNKKLVAFMNAFTRHTSVQLDPIYTSKMLYGVVEMIRTGRIPKDSNVVAVHSGGLQGLEGKHQEMARLMGDI